MLERRVQPLISRKAFANRMLRWIFATFMLLTLSLGAGMFGYSYFEDMPWVDALHNASMILGGMGEISVLHSFGGKIFSSFYALYCGVILIVCAGLMLVPVFHRVLHRFHED